MLANHYPGKTEMQIRKLFGSGFTESVFALEPGVWHGPVLSGYGTHLVFVHEHIKNEVPPLTEVREYVVEDWMAEKKAELEQRYIDGLLARYEVIVEDND
jgi:parvulin-like peptidyl-prolyl isomerase